MFIKNTSNLLRKIAGELNGTNTQGFAPGHIRTYFQQAADTNKPLLYTYDPMSSVTDSEKSNRILDWFKKQKKHSNPIYRYTTTNVPIMRNAGKHAGIINKMITDGFYDHDAFSAAITDDKNYPSKLREHLSSVQDNDWNKVFKPMPASDRLTMNNTRVPIERGANFEGSAYYHSGADKIVYDPADIRQQMFLSDMGTEKFQQKKQHHSDGYLADILAINNLPAILHHEGNHAAQISKQQGMLSRMFNMSPNKPVLTDKHLNPSDFNKGHMDRLVEQRQAAQSFNRANYALARLLQNADLTHPDFKQFDKHKLMHVRDKFKELPKSRQEFIQRMQWYGQNPEIALLLGESARGVAYRKEKEDVASNGRTALGEGSKQEAANSIKQFDDGWFLAKHQSNKKTYNRRHNNMYPA